MLSYLVHILTSKEENGLVAAALWALLQLAAEDSTNQKVNLRALHPNVRIDCRKKACKRFSSMMQKTSGKVDCSKMPDRTALP